MILFEETTCPSEFLTSIVNVFNTCIATIKNIWWVIAIIIAVWIAITSIFSIRKKTKKYTIRQLSALKNNGKYIPKVFIELNDSKEVLRYFLYGRKWKKRLVQKYNNIYDNFYGKTLRKGNKDEQVTFHLSRFSRLSTIENAVTNALSYHNRFGKRKVDFKEEYAETEPIFEIIHLPYETELEKLQYFCNATNSDYLVLTGSAGNGKTNLLCSISELAINLKEAVVFLNSREINEEIDDYILKQLNISQFWIKHKRIYFWFVNVFLRLRRKHLYIIIDAVNENDSPVFSEKVRNFVNSCAKYRRYKVIVSCRNEYFKDRFADILLKGITQRNLLYDVKSENYPATAVNRLFSIYRKHFNYSGVLSDGVRYVLSEHLLLLRMFFEVMKDSSESVLSIQKHEIFEAYIKQIQKTTSPNIDIILEEIADEMIKTRSFDCIGIDKLLRFSQDEIEKTFDESVLICKTLVFHENTIASTNSEVVRFVFDEVRDYCIARRIMHICTTANSVNGNQIIHFLNEIHNEKASCEEGIMHYAYAFFRTDKTIDQCQREKLCKEILSFYQTEDLDKGYYFYHQGQQNLNNFGLRILFTIGFPLLPHEKEYIKNCLLQRPNEDGDAIFYNALLGTKHDLIINLDVYYDILFSIRNKTAIIQAYKTIANIDGMPVDLIYQHRLLVPDYPDRALQVQRAAELFMGMFSLHDANKERVFHAYFESLPTHETVKNEMRNRLFEAIQEENK